MRKIKLKVWDKENKTFIKLKDNGLHMLDNCQIYKGNKNVTDNYILLQCTNIKDRNGKSIYFNDILKTSKGQYILIKEIIYGWMPFISLDKGKTFIRQTNIRYTQTARVIGNLVQKLK